MIMIHCGKTKRINETTNRNFYKDGYGVRMKTQEKVCQLVYEKYLNHKSLLRETVRKLKTKFQESENLILVSLEWKIKEENSHS